MKTDNEIKKFQQFRALQELEKLKQQLGKAWNLEHQPSKELLAAVSGLCRAILEASGLAQAILEALRHAEAASKPPLPGHRISQGAAYEGLGDPKDWESEEKALLKKFQAKCQAKQETAEEEAEDSSRYCIIELSTGEPRCYSRREGGEVFWMNGLGTGDFVWSAPSRQQAEQAINGLMMLDTSWVFAVWTVKQTRDHFIRFDMGLSPWRGFKQNFPPKHPYVYFLMAGNEWLKRAPGEDGHALTTDHSQAHRFESYEAASKTRQDICSLPMFNGKTCPVFHVVVMRELEEYTEKCRAKARQAAQALKPEPPATKNDCKNEQVLGTAPQEKRDISSTESTTYAPEEENVNELANEFAPKCERCGRPQKLKEGYSAVLEDCPCSEEYFIPTEWLEKLKEGYSAVLEESEGGLKKKCSLPPEGWSCSREAGHEGPCAASPVCQKGTPWHKA